MVGGGDDAVCTIPRLHNTRFNTKSFVVLGAISNNKLLDRVRNMYVPTIREEY